MTLLEKKRRIETLAHIMQSLAVFNIFAGRDMACFSEDETQAFNDAVTALDHFVSLASIQT